MINSLLWCQAWIIYSLTQLEKESTEIKHVKIIDAWLTCIYSLMKQFDITLQDYALRNILSLSILYRLTIFNAHQYKFVYTYNLIFLFTQLLCRSIFCNNDCAASCTVLIKQNDSAHLCSTLTRTSCFSLVNSLVLISMWKTSVYKLLLLSMRTSTFETSLWIICMIVQICNVRV